MKLNPEKFLLKNGMEVTFRSFEEGDEEKSKQFVQIVSRESTHTLKYENIPEILNEKYMSLRLAYNEHPVDINFGAFYNSELIGNLRFFQRNSTHPWIKHVGAFGMSTRKDFWGNGLGSKMLQIMEAHARRTEIKRIEAEVRALNDRGIRLYLKNGFKIEGLREKAAFIDGSYRDEYYIAKILL